MQIFFELHHLLARVGLLDCVEDAFCNDRLLVDASKQYKNNKENIYNSEKRTKTVTDLGVVEGWVGSYHAMAEIDLEIICKIKVLGKFLLTNLKWRVNIHKTCKLTKRIAANREAVLVPRTLQDGALEKWKRTYETFQEENICTILFWLSWDVGTFTKLSTGNIRVIVRRTKFE